MHFQRHPIQMTNTLDHASQAQILEIDVWLQSAMCKEGFAITRRIVHDTIAEMNLFSAAEAEMIEGFTSAGLL